MNKILYYIQKFKIYITNSAWVLLGLIIRTLIVIFIVSKIANQIGLSDFGWYNLAISVFTILYAVSTLGFGDTFIIKYFVNGKFSPEEILGTTFISRILCSLFILLLLAFWVSNFTNYNNSWVIVIASLAMLFQSSEVFKAYFQWKLKAKVYVPVDLFSLIIVAILLIYGLFKGYGLFYFISIYALERFLILIGLLFYVNNEISLKRFIFNLKLFKALFIQAWPLLLGAILTALYARFDQVLIKYFLTAEDLGLYGTGIVLCQMWLIIPSLIIPIVLPKIAEFKNLSNKIKYRDTLYMLYGVLNYLAILIIIFIFVFGELIIKYLYGVEYLDSVFILKILILNLIIQFQSHLTSSVLIIENEENYLFKIKLVSVVTNILLNVLLLSIFGVRFAAYSLLISSILSWVILAYFNKTMLKLMKLNIKSFLLPLHIKQLLK